MLLKLKDDLNTLYFLVRIMDMKHKTIKRFVMTAFRSRSYI